MPISAVIITNNEAQNIERALLSLEGVVDDIVVVDSGSTDATEALCQTKGVRFFSQPWLGYGPQKNYGTEHAHHDYILSIDADEALDETLRKSILALKDRFDCGIYSFNCLPNYCGHWIRHCGWYPNRLARLYDRRQARWNDSGVHEGLISAPTTKRGYLVGDLLHYSYHSISDHHRKNEHYARLGAAQIHAQGGKPSELKALLASGFKFFQSYILRLGVLDGLGGLQVCRLSAQYSYKKYHYAHLLSRGLTLKPNPYTNKSPK